MSWADQGGCGDFGHDTAAQLAEQTIALVDRETKERDKGGGA